MTKIKLKQSTHISRKVLLFGRELEISDACMNIRFRPGYSRSHWNIQWCGGSECGTKRGHCKLYSKNRSGGCCSSYCLAYAACKKWVGRQHTTFTLCQNAACSNLFFLQWVDHDWANVHYFSHLFHTERSWRAYLFSAVYFGTAWFSLWCGVKSIFFNLLWNVNIFITAKKKFCASWI